MLWQNVEKWVLPTGEINLRSNGSKKTAAGLRLKRWFKEDWRTPRGKKIIKVERTPLDQQKELVKIHHLLGVNYPRVKEEEHR